LVAGRQVGPVFVPDRLVFFIPYIFLDRPMPLISGREVYGLHKELCTVGLPGPGEEPELLTLDAPALERFEPDARVAERRLIDVRRVAKGSGEVPERELRAEMKAMLRDRLLQGGWPAAAPWLARSLSALRRDGLPTVRVVNFKQVRDARDGTLACYQAIIES